MNDIEKMQSLLNERDLERLKEIYEPTVVCIQPDNSHNGICVMPDGEIRSYGVLDSTLEGEYRLGYLSSRNCGMDWTRVYLPEGCATTLEGGMVPAGKLIMGGAVPTPWSNKFVCLATLSSDDKKGTYAMLSDVGPDDPEPRMVKITDDIYGSLFLPTMLEGRKRIITTGSGCSNHNYKPAVFYSDDDGETWNIVALKNTPKHEVEFPHLGRRWENNGAEPNLVELPGGRLMLIMRTSLDYFYLYYSDDGGETWTDGEPSDFHGTLTSPFFLRLHDDRVVLFWNNTRPLAEPDHEKTWPPVSAGVKAGWGEDAFTNRDANHAAITDDGVNWTGFREIYLNSRRNAADFRVRGNDDNSVHQFQAIELPYGKILVAFGQHEYSRRTAIFDVKWLYEKENREDFSNGLTKVTTHLFVKSVSDSHYNQRIPGHCAWNRTNGALLLPDPTGNFREALQICRIRDQRLVSELQGAVWNFPKAYRGKLTMEIYIAGEGVNVRLCDHWMNAGDPHVGLWSIFDFKLDKNVLAPNAWHEIVMQIDTVGGSMQVMHEDKLLLTVPMKQEAPNGVSYIHLQTAAQEEDFAGTYIRKLHFEKLD